MKADLKKPCNQCPFAKKCHKGWLGERRAEEIAKGIVEDDHSTFTCHKTDRKYKFAEPETTEETQHCGGAMLFLMNCGAQNLFMRFAFSAGVLKPADLTEANRKKVFGSVEDFIKHHS